jgi:hypothetical protein
VVVLDDSGYPWSSLTVAGASEIRRAKIYENRSISPIFTTLALADRRYMRSPAISAMSRR